MDNMKHLIKVCDIEKYWGAENNITKAVNRVRFQVDEGEFIGIMGASDRKNDAFEYDLHDRPGERRTYLLWRYGYYMLRRGAGKVRKEIWDLSFRSLTCWTC